MALAGRAEVSGKGEKAMAQTQRGPNTKGAMGAGRQPVGLVLAA